MHDCAAEYGEVMDQCEHFPGELKKETERGSSSFAEYE